MLTIALILRIVGKVLIIFQRFSSFAICNEIVNVSYIKIKFQCGDLLSFSTIYIFLYLCCCIISLLCIPSDLIFLVQLSFIVIEIKSYKTSTNSFLEYLYQIIFEYKDKLKGEKDFSTAVSNLHFTRDMLKNCTYFISLK